MNKLWWKAAGRRALRSAAQGAITAIGTEAFGITDVSWLAVASSAALMAVLSLLMSLAGLPEVKQAEEIEAQADQIAALEPDIKTGGTD